MEAHTVKEELLGILEWISWYWINKVSLPVSKCWPMPLHIQHSSAAIGTVSPLMAGHGMYCTADSIMILQYEETVYFCWGQAMRITKEDMQLWSSLSTNQSINLAHVFFSLGFIPYKVHIAVHTIVLLICVFIGHFKTFRQKGSKLLRNQILNPRLILYAGTYFWGFEREILSSGVISDDH